MFTKFHVKLGVLGGVYPPYLPKWLHLIYTFLGVLYPPQGGIWGYLRMCTYHSNSHQHAQHAQLNLLLLTKFSGKLWFWSKNDPNLVKIPPNNPYTIFPLFFQRHKGTKPENPWFLHTPSKWSILGQKTLPFYIFFTQTPPKLHF